MPSCTDTAFIGASISTERYERQRVLVEAVSAISCVD